MFKQANFTDEIASSMEDKLISHTTEKQSGEITKAIDHLNIAAEIFDGLGLVKEAEATTRLLEVVAAKKKKKTDKSKSKTKSKSKPKKKSPNGAISGLTSEKMVENLKEKGWVFNVDDLNLNDDHEDECDCSLCDDTNYSIDDNYQDMIEEWEDEVEEPHMGHRKTW